MLSKSNGIHSSRFAKHKFYIHYNLQSKITKKDTINCNKPTKTLSECSRGWENIKHVFIVKQLAINSVIHILYVDIKVFDAW